MFWAKNTGPEAGTPHDDPGRMSGRYRDGSDLGARTASRAGIRVAIRVPKYTGMFAARRQQWRS